MKNRLLIGEGATANLINLNRAFRLSLVRNGKSHFKTSDLEFHPLLNCASALNDLTLEKFRSLSTRSFRKSSLKCYLDNARETFNNPSVRLCFELMGEEYQIVPYTVCIENWQEFISATNLLGNASPWMKMLFDELIFDVWLLSKHGSTHYYGGGASTYDSLGLIFMSFRPPSKFQQIEMAIALAHELGHNCFFLLQSGQRPISKESWAKKVYSGVRQVERPAIASFHAAVALGYMLSFSHQLRSQNELCSELGCKSFLDERIHFYNVSLSKGLEALKYLKLSDMGKIVSLELLQLRDSCS